MFGVNATPSNKLNLFANLTYSKSEQSFEDIDIENRVKQLQMMGGKAGVDWAAQNYAWGAVLPDFSEVNNWTDLDMNQIEINIGGTYMITDKISLNTSLLYGKYNDNEYYIEDDDGEYYAVNAAIEYKF